MGLVIHPGGAQWSYSGFNEFRERLAREEGFELREMEGFGRHWKGEPPGMRSWATVNTTLTELLHHSDCDGYLESYPCEQMLPRLREIAERWDARRFGDPELQYDAAQLRRLIVAMEHSVEHGCAVVFA